MKKKFVLPALFGCVFLITGCAGRNSSKESIASFKGKECSVRSGNVSFEKSLNNAETLCSIDSSGSLVMNCGAKSDYFNAPDGKEKYGNAPILLTEVNNRRSFTFSAKITPSFVQTYDAGALYIYCDDNLWQKFAFEMDERGNKRIVTVRTGGTSDDNNHDVIKGESVFLKISSDKMQIGFYYSADNIEWQLVRVYKNEYPQKIFIGISSQSPLGNGIETRFSECSLTYESIKDFRMGT